MTGLGRYLAERHWKRAALWLCFLAPFFFITYGFANSVTAALPHVDSVVFAWERGIPFLPWMIIPYWSIDAFYGLSLFLWTSRRDLDRHALRLVAATLICVSGFLLFPLKFSFARPDIQEPLFRLLFDLLETFDQPYNQAPSLHICLLLIVWDAFRRNVPARLRPVVHIWAAVIAVSVFTTYQHHSIDGVLAVPAGLLCCYLIPLGNHSQESSSKGKWSSGDPVRSRRLGVKYIGATLFFAGGGLAGCLLHTGWWAVLFWPGFCFGAVAAGYLGAGPSVFQKTPGMGPQAGSRSFAARILLAPYEYGAKFYRRKYLRCLPKAAEVAPGLWIGAYPKALPTPECGVLDFTAEYVRPLAQHTGVNNYAAMPLLDLLPPNSDELAEALRYLKTLRHRGPVLVHCALGMTRSALVVACELVQSGICANMDAALARVASARPCIIVHPEAAAIAQSLLEQGAQRDQKEYQHD